jgi:signal transduction histidine kinase
MEVPTGTGVAVGSGFRASRRRASVSVGSVRYAAAVVVIAVGYYAFTEGGKALLLTGPAGAFWPGAGLGIAVLYLGGVRWWPGLLLGDLASLVVDVIEHGVPPGSALAEAAGDMARTLVAVVILWRLAGRRIALDRLQDVRAVLIAVVAGAAVSATVAMLALLAGDVLNASETPVFWRSWWLGDVSGGLVILPLALAWARPPAPELRRGGAWEAALMIAGVVALSVIAVSADQPLTYLVFPAFIWAALRFGPQGATLAVAVAVVIAVWGASNELGPFVEHSPDDSALNLQLYITLAALTTLCLAAIVSERRRATLDVADSRARILAATDAERRRIERDLHDGAQQRLVMLRVRLGLAGDLMQRDPAAARRMIGELGGEVEDALDDVRSLATGIYPSVLADYGLGEALRLLALQSRIAASVEIDGADRCRPEVEAAVYFCCSEALQNAAKHANRASAVSISLERNGDLRFEVHDDGPGFSLSQAGSGHGLANMHDRIEGVNGTLDIRSAPGNGTIVIGRIPNP